MSSSLRLSVIIVNWNVRELLRNCLLSLQENIGLPTDCYEVIVVDNASGDGSTGMLRREFSGVILIENDVNPGYGRGCEHGYALARGDYVWLLNPDTVVPRGAVTMLLAMMDSEPKLGILGPRLVNGDGSFQRVAAGAFPTLRNAAWNYFFLNRLLPRSWAPAPMFLEDDLAGTFDIDWVSGAAMMLRRAALGAYVLDDPFFAHADDMDVCDRVRQKGWDVKYTSDCFVVHFHGRSLEQQTDLAILLNAHKGGPRRFFYKHHGAPARLAYDSMVASGHFIRWLLYGTLSAVKPSSRYSGMSAFSRQYLVTMLRALWARSSK